MSGIPFEAIAAAALSQAESLLPEWFPNGKFKGKYFKVGSIQGDAGESLSINTDTGAWKDFAGGPSGGDMTALYAAKFCHDDQSEAAHKLGARLGIQVNGYSHADSRLFRYADSANGQANGAAKPKPGKRPDEWKPMVPPPDGVPPPDKSLFRGADHIYEYTDLAGRVTHYVKRTDARNGQKKLILPVTYGTLNGATGWHSKHPANPLSLYGLHRLAALPDAPVLLVEGEKSADAAQALLPKYPCLSWARGASSAHLADLTPLQGRQVVIWPDADEPGRKAAMKIAAKLNVEAIVRTDDLAEGSDAADLDAEALGTKTPAAWLNERLVKVEPPEETVADPPDEDAADSGEDDESEPTGLGMGLTGKGARKGVNAAIARLNEKYMVVSEAGKTVIYREEYEPVLKRHTYARMSFGDFKNLFMNRSIRVGTDAAGSPTYKCIADVWLKSPRRREYPDGITFDPIGQHAEGKLNLWRDFSVEARPGDWSKMKDHVKTIICGANQTYYDYLMDWAAALIQNPAEAGQVAIVMKGGQGTGKGIFARALIRLLSYHALAIAHTKHLVGNFNSHLRDIVLLFTDEAFFAGDRAHIGVLNSLITEPYLAIEGKGQNLITVPNYLHVIMASNEAWVVPADLDSRRYFVLLVSAAMQGNHQYFQAIQDQMEAGGYEAMLYELKHRDISNFNVRAVPVTEGLVEQRKLSLPVPEAWWKDCLERGYVFRSKIGLEKHFAEWHEKVSTEILFASYTEFANQHRERHPLSREAFGRFMTKMAGEGSGCRLTNAPVGEHIVDVDVSFGVTVRKAQPHLKSRPPGYGVGTLDVAREAFEKATGLSVNWDKDD
jgi:hypothetical protein